MIPQEALNAASRAVLDLGVKVLQGARLADTDAGHIDCLLEFMAPARGTLWADIGCGFGEVARLMQERRQDLDFVLVNANWFQLSVCPDDFRKLLADMHDIPLAAASVDGCMFCYSLCHATPIEAALTEAARITRPGGALFVFDYARLSGTDWLMQERLCATAIPLKRLRQLLGATGWGIVNGDLPTCDDTLFRQLYGNDEEYAQIFGHLHPLLFKAVKL